MRPRIEELLIVISEANLAYYAGEPIISDDEYDSLKGELAELDPTNPLLFSVGAEPPVTSPLQKLQHTIPMFSLAKCNEENEFLVWAKKMNTNQFVIQPKFDGLSVECIYRNGKLIEVLTRGDGLIGESILHNVLKMEEVHKELPIPFSGSLRGECILLLSDFKAYFKDYANARNAVAGVVRSLDNPLAKHAVIFFFDCLPDSGGFTTENEKLEFINNELRCWAAASSVCTIEEVLHEYEHYSTLERKNINYEIDGLVIKVNDIAKQLEMGDVNGTPRAQIAWKFAPEMRETIVKDIVWQIGKTGRIAPVAILEPVHLCGVTISRATLHNARRVKDLGIGPGSVVLVSRRNDVIPAVEKCISTLDTIFEIPSKCPECGSVLKFEGEYLVCKNKECKGNNLGNLEKWVKILGIDEVGPAFLETAMEAGLIKDIADLYKLTRVDIETLPGYGQASADIIIKNLHANKTLRFPIFFAGLNIPMCSVSTFEALEKAGFDTVEKLIGATLLDFSGISGIGETTARAITDGLYERTQLIEKLLENGIEIEKKKAGKLNGMSFCFTGEISIKRSLAQQLVRDMGGDVKTSVSKGLTYLVQASPTSISGKSKKALEYGTKIMGEEEFLDLVEFSSKKLK